MSRSFTFGIAPQMWHQWKVWRPLWTHHKVTESGVKHCDLSLPEFSCPLSLTDVSEVSLLNCCLDCASGMLAWQRGAPVCLHWSGVDEWTLISKICLPESHCLWLKESMLSRLTANKQNWRQDNRKTKQIIIRTKVENYTRNYSRSQSICDRMAFTWHAGFLHIPPH